MSDTESRKEGMQRIQIGLAGLTGVVLLIGLANLVVDNARRSDATADDNMSAAANVATAVPLSEKPAEPLAELGVAPAATSAPDAESNGQPPVVADLQPDPNLRQPMDRPPPMPTNIPPPDTSKPAQR